MDEQDFDKLYGSKLPDFTSSDWRMMEGALDRHDLKRKLTRLMWALPVLGSLLLGVSATLFYQLKEFVRLCTVKPLGIVISAAYLDKLFDVNFYLDLSGGLLEGLGKLLGRFSRIYIYPHKTNEVCIMTKSFFPKSDVKNIYNHFVENKNIQDIAGCDQISEYIHSDDVNKLIKKKDAKWKKLVPEKIHSLV